MSTRRSFIRKVKSVDIRVPDADRIEGIVKSGQLNRHGSIRRKIVPQPQDFANDSLYSDQSDTSPVKFTSTPNATFAELDLTNDTVLISGQHNGSALTPYIDVEKELGITPTDSLIVDAASTEMAPLDDATIQKIKDCLDAEKVKDIYTLGSTLQDLLSAAEIEEIISNSHRYGNVISRDLLLALSEGRIPENVLSNKHGHTQNQRDSADNTPPDLIDSNDMSKNFKLFSFRHSYFIDFIHFHYN